MKKDVVIKLRTDFEDTRFFHKDTGVEFWFARDLQELLGYIRWENFVKVIDKAKTACEGAGYSSSDHFLDVTKKAHIGSGAVREIEDMVLTLNQWIRRSKST